MILIKKRFWPCIIFMFNVFIFTRLISMVSLFSLSFLFVSQHFFHHPISYVVSIVIFVDPIVHPLSMSPFLPFPSFPPSTSHCHPNKTPLSIHCLCSHFAISIILFKYLPIVTQTRFQCPSIIYVPFLPFPSSPYPLLPPSTSHCHPNKIPLSIYCLCPLLAISIIPPYTFHCHPNKTPLYIHCSCHLLTIFIIPPNTSHCHPNKFETTLRPCRT